MTAGLLGAGLWLRAADSGRPEGPVTSRISDIGSGSRKAVGDPLSFGHVYLVNSADDEAVIERIRILGVTGGLEVIGVKTRLVPDEQGRATFINLSGYPPAEWPARPLREQHRVPAAAPSSEDLPETGLALVIGARASRPGIARAQAVEIHYRIGRKGYRHVVGGAMAICAPADAYSPQDCPGETRDQFDDGMVEFEVVGR